MGFISACHAPFRERESLLTLDSFLINNKLILILIYYFIVTYIYIERDKVMSIQNVLFPIIYERRIQNDRHKIMIKVEQIDESNASCYFN